ncbi:carboxymuconolactone decarboxylase family protein [Aquisalimonas sp. 2447]|uniref:carboxymuconolactone decarboxylase family protein n=1 Tax=Aquisalimonas sp. 2447 TaxID=2740807 RepID=UPI001432439A|nr:carboxymuconolactone decarboxylase family protein [Aquisalimonas sp. 2447]QIT55263.1 carboxymuconolactone decarboxylase family protein [Aquisalimonas sp. 2447]
MYKDWTNNANELSKLLGEVQKGIPQVAKGFSSLARAATADGALSPAQKELMAIAISVAVRCEGCITFHAKAAVKHGASREELLETIGVGTYMGGGPSHVYGAQALDAFDQFAAA